MKNIRPADPKTVVDEKTGEWLPPSFPVFLTELNNLVETCRMSNALSLFRGHSNRSWLLDSTFVRSAKTDLLGVRPEDRISLLLSDSLDLHLALLNLFLLKFGCLVRPSDELELLAQEAGLDSWFELLKRLQQYPAEDLAHFKGTNLIDWTQSADIALYFANTNRDGEGALFVCDATATGKTLQTKKVGAILDLMADARDGSRALGPPLLFHPAKQSHMQRAKNQEAVYFAQLEMRSDLESQWSDIEQNTPEETIIIKLVLPAGTEDIVADHLNRKGINDGFVFPPEPE